MCELAWRTGWTFVAAMSAGDAGHSREGVGEAKTDIPSFAAEVADKCLSLCVRINLPGRLQNV